jgi:hypothetical protein
MADSQVPWAWTLLAARSATMTIVALALRLADQLRELDRARA